jgi:hypothetical protein
MHGRGVCDLRSKVWTAAQAGIACRDWGVCVRDRQIEYRFQCREKKSNEALAS